MDFGIRAYKYAFTPQNNDGALPIVVPDALENRRPYLQDYASAVTFFLSDVGRALLLLGDDAWFQTSDETQELRQRMNMIAGQYFTDLSLSSQCRNGVLPENSGNDSSYQGVSLLRLITLFFYTRADDHDYTPPYRPLIETSGGCLKPKPVISREAMNKQILVVEDNSDNSTLVTWILEDEGYEVTCVESGEECLEILERARFDAILMDISLPGMSGKNVTRLIRQNPKLLGIPILALTAHAIESEQQAILDCGVNHLITKPINDDLLLSLLRNSFLGE